MSEDHATRLKRLAMRSARRGTKEMDIILGRYAGVHLAAMAPGRLDLYEALLEENDQDLYQWVTGQVPPPSRYSALLAEIAEHTGTAARG
ncbi:succinate dehydrogenase assembly factor 2 [Sinisalibacter lacisalsi]|uniref:FAD assembly factor SdhE n=1 Tax=Sinisalibacter lacisalsi TaxID=1526570 RepID=A0ABQ1QVB0_9RHOB|nr:succinate dehydrogenase assembly factor 2 [Sinisalibacter lacisalsi]GGD44024.1 succinate dehydrogenase assembly factor 2 [Sinisalibacter lacisalsi]